jgi:hypothetical protein
MKTLALDSGGLTLEQLLREAVGNSVVFLTDKGKTRYALVPADDFDQEISALQQNPEFMAYLTELEKDARNKPCKTIEAVRKEFGLPTRPAPKK